MKKLIAEFIGTFWLVLGGCGSAVLAASFPELGIGFVGVSLAFGLTVVTMAYAIGHISGCHLNPAVSIGLAVGGRFDKKDLIPYIISQVMGAIAGAGILYLIVSGKSGFEIGGFAANGFGEHSPGGYDMLAAFVTEAVMTFFFLIIILGATLFAEGSWAIPQLWLFWIAPIVGAILAGIVYSFLSPEKE